ncbi:hypothetical protein [Streptomyces sp. NPDC005017]|uniref:hypothetical protein n=1 Tax=Streptomyces sp. NPDC005017 TaxID=3364706 RepID=UPI00367E84A9
MGRVLTTASTVTCPHATGPPPPPPTPQPGLVTVSSTEKLKVTGSPVLVKTSLTTVSNCPNATSGVACASVSAVLGGESTKLRSAGKPVLLDALVLSTNAVPASPVLRPAPNQAKLSSV